MIQLFSKNYIGSNLPENTIFNMKHTFLAIATFITSGISTATDTVLGFWKTIDDETHEAKSIVQVYEYQNKIYGRVVDILKNKQARAKIPGSPPIKGLDIIWDLEKDGSKYTGGKVLDPERGKVYSCKIWIEKGNLIMRGSLFGFGREQTWLPAIDYTPSSTQAPIPKIPKN